MGQPLREKENNVLFELFPEGISQFIGGSMARTLGNQNDSSEGGALCVSASI